MKSTLFYLRDVTKHYGNRTVLHVDELTIYQSEILTIIGPSGSGKSTLLRLLNFLNQPSSGKIQFAESTYDDLTRPALDVRRRITTVFQRPVLLNRTVYENVAYGLKLRSGASRRLNTSRDPVSVALSQVKLTHLANKSARTLSGGEMQRVALARAMVLRPDVLLLDEPTANLDPQNVAMIESIVRMLNEELGTTIVLVTHNIFQARRLAHRVLFLLDGRIIESGTREDFFDNPQDSKTQSFIKGDMIY
ncbi:phosphate ABC transporter ATP-binding protein [Chloroflexi bacterium TSY]|nr:phosphate ABC transporter ATP-binding protein [Chloroflexi bacterium TSY]